MCNDKQLLSQWKQPHSARAGPLPERVALWVQELSRQYIVKSMIQLPTFSGDLEEYESFTDQFQAQIGYKTDLQPVTKLQYLKSQLKGRALDLIRGFTSVSDNYQSALDTLKETYGDEEKIKHCLLQKIINLEPPKHNRSDLENFRIR